MLGTFEVREGNNMKLNDLERVLVSFGYTLNRVNSHRIWVKPNALYVALPNHRDVKKMIANKILKQIHAGVTV